MEAVNEALRDLEIIRDKFVEYKNKVEGKNIKCSFSPQFCNVRTALVELQQIKSAEPTKALECLENIILFSKDYDDVGYYKFEKEYNTIKQALMKPSNAERCWEIVKEKADFIPAGKFKNWNYDLYVRWFDLNHYDTKWLLTQEEFELLKCEVGK